MATKLTFLLLIVACSVGYSSAFWKYKWMQMDEVETCEDTKGQLLCPKNRFIRVNTATWGRSDSTTCSEDVSYAPGSTEMSGRCLDDVTKSIRKRCNNKKCCGLSAKSHLSDSCPNNIYKVLNVDYSCKYRQQQICEGAPRTLKCPPNKLIRIKHAYYGRVSSWGCRQNKKYPGRPEKTHPSMNPASVCKANPKMIKQELKNRCNGQGKCKISSDVEELGMDPCQNINKYVRVMWACIPEEEYVKEELILCEGSTANLQCPTGTMLKIANVMWGRTNSIECSDIVHGRSKLEVRAGCDLDVTKTVKAMCQFESSCTFDAINSVLGNAAPCYGISKVAKIKWSCMPEAEV